MCERGLDRERSETRCTSDRIATSPKPRLHIYKVQMSSGGRKIDKGEEESFTKFSKTVHNQGVYAVTPADTSMIDEWILELSKCASMVIPYPHAFDYTLETVPRRYVTGIPWVFVQNKVLAGCPGTHPDRFVAPVASRFTEIDCLSLKDNVISSNAVWLTIGPRSKAQGSHQGDLRKAFV